MNLKNKTSEIWDKHYTKEKSKLKFPDENLVRILSSAQKKGKALDFGAGSGRHCLLLKSMGFEVTAADYSENSNRQIKDLDHNFKTVLIQSLPFGFEDEEFDVIVCWGVLHYNEMDYAKKIVSEFKRILKTDGILVGTIRSTNDTHLKEKNSSIQLDDLKDGQIFLYNLEDTKKLLQDFPKKEFGYSERTPMGKLEERICHWIFKAQK